MGPTFMALLLAKAKKKKGVNCCWLSLLLPLLLPLLVLGQMCCRNAF